VYYGLGTIFMLGDVVAAYVKELQGRVGRMEKTLSDYKLYVAEHYASKEFLSDLKRKSPSRYATLDDVSMTFSIPIGTDGADKDRGARSPCNLFAATRHFY
jgi:hypothetical protein